MQRSPSEILEFLAEGGEAAHIRWVIADPFIGVEHDRICAILADGRFLDLTRAMLDELLSNGLVAEDHPAEPDTGMNYCLTEAGRRAIAAQPRGGRPNRRRDGEFGPSAP